MNTKHAQYMLTVLQEGSITAAARGAAYKKQESKRSILYLHQGAAVPMVSSPCSSRVT